MFSSLMRDDYNPLNLHALIPATGLGFSSEYFEPTHVHLNVLKPRRQTSVSSFGKNPNKPNEFQVMLNVKHFRPNEIIVKTVNNYVVVHGKHEEQADEHGLVSREFKRRFLLPDDVEPGTVSTSLTQDGVLTIQAPRKQLESTARNERVVPITIQQPASAEVQKQVKEQQIAQASEETKSELNLRES